MSANHATSTQDPLCLDYFCRIGVSTSFDFSVGFYRYNVQQNDFNTWRPCESYLFSDLPLYLWLVFVYHEVHEDHEEFIIKLYRPLRFKPRGLPRGFLVTWFHFVPFVLFVVIFLYLASLEANNKTTDYRLPTVKR